MAKAAAPRDRCLRKGTEVELAKEELEEMAEEIAAKASETVSLISRPASDNLGWEECLVAAERFDGLCRIRRSRDRSRSIAELP